VALGYITGRVTVEPRRVLPRRGVVEDWYVAPDSRGAGVGSSLLHELEARFAAAGCEVIESATWSSNEGARRAHDALGFREIRVMYRKRI
jgi:ribosomal protein S18 acetylase RimI-like enzyme